jgi:hypothetical protein
LPQRQRISVFHAQVHTSASPTEAVPILFKSHHSPYRLNNERSILSMGQAG